LAQWGEHVKMRHDSASQAVWHPRPQLDSCHTAVTEPCNPKTACPCAHSARHIPSLLIHHFNTWRHCMSALYEAWILTWWDGRGRLTKPLQNRPSLLLSISLLKIPRPIRYTDTSRRSLGSLSRHAVLLSFYQPVDTDILCPTVSPLSIITIAILLSLHVLVGLRHDYCDN